MMRSFPRLILILVVLAVSASIVLAAKTCRDCGASNKDADKFCKSCGARLPEVPPPQPATPRLAGSSSVDGPIVRITSQPSGAGVAIDGRNRGRTPLELSDLEPGRHDYELTRGGYRPFYGEFTIAGLFGSIVVTTEPVGAEVLLDDKPKGTAPDGGLTLVRVPYGRHTITARLQNYNDAVKAVDLKEATPVGVTLRLGYGKGWLVVVSDPPGASLYVNDTNAGKTPVVAEFPPARYSLGVQRSGYYDWTGDANIQYAESTTVRAILDRIPTRKLPLLSLSVVSLGVGVASAVLGELEYSKYQAATNPTDARAYHQSTMAWDIGRDAALAAGIVLGGAYWMLRW